MPHSEYSGVKHVVEINSQVQTTCEICSERVGGSNFAASINHYLEKHGYKILYFGPLSDHDSNHDGWLHFTTAILGKR